MKYIFFSKLVLLLFQSRRYFILPAASLMREKQGRNIQANTRNDKLEEAGIRYNFFYLMGLAGNGYGERNALRSAEIFNKLHPISIGFLSLTLFPESQLYQEIVEGQYEEATEYERIDEMICLIEHLTCKTHILARTVSNPIPFTGSLPTDRQLLINDLRSVKESLSEEQLRSYRDNIESL